MLRRAILLLAAASLALPIDARRPPRPTKQDAIPKLTLPWGTWEGKPYGEDGETTLFKNVRFGQAPVDDLRFAAPKYPEPIKDVNKVQDSSYGPSCIQATPKANVTYEPIGNDTQAEDCLFLDVYVPTWALDLGVDDELLPVVVWIYGGAYVFGSKDLEFKLEEGPFYAYDGQGIRDATDNSIIWVTGNYRMGAFGFLAGETMEEHAQPNAGLHDQRLLFDWVQKYIGLVGGDKDTVNAWGLSAGAGSILHHLTAYGGSNADEPPLFHRVAMWSPAYKWGYDRAGALEETFHNFSTKAECSSSENMLQCLREADQDVLRKANQDIVSAAMELGMFPFGLAVDGDLVPELPAFLLSKGQHHNVSSLIVSHAHDEVSMFLAKWVDSAEDFSHFLCLAFPGDALSSIRQKIETKYPAEFFDYKQKQRMRNVLNHSTFVCNVRQIYNAYASISDVYTAKFDMPPAQHGFDIFAIIWHGGVNASDMFEQALSAVPGVELDILDKVWPPFASRYQKYYAGHAVTGYPNSNSGYGLEWEITEDNGNQLTNSLMAGMYFQHLRSPFFKLGMDWQNSMDNCEFWDEIARDITEVLGAKEAEKMVQFQTQMELRRDEPKALSYIELIYTGHFAKQQSS